MYGRIYLSRLNSQAQTRTIVFHFLCLADDEQDYNLATTYPIDAQSALRDDPHQQLLLILRFSLVHELNNSVAALNTERANPPVKI